MGSTFTSLHILADHRERSSATVSALESMSDVDLTITHLSLGDYLVDDRILFERKSLPDLARSIIDGRLLEQACRLASSPVRGVLILEGRGSDLNDCGIRREAVQGALITISLILGIPILRSLDGDESARLMIYAGRQVQRIAHGGLPRVGKRPRGKERTQLEVLQSFPGIGPGRARRLLERFGSIEAIIGASAEELMEARGIGRRTAEGIRRIVSESINRP